MTDNIFLAIENYLAAPSKAVAEKVKRASDELATVASDQVVEHHTHKLTREINSLDKKIKHGLKKINDEIPELEKAFKKFDASVQELNLLKKGMTEVYQTAQLQEQIEAMELKIQKIKSFIKSFIDNHPAVAKIQKLEKERKALQDEIKDFRVDIDNPDFQKNLSHLMKGQAKEAFETSTRLVHNHHVNDLDPKYIFRLSEAEEKQVLALQNEAKKESKSTGVSPHGLAFAINGYIERVKPSAEESREFGKRQSAAEDYMQLAQSEMQLAEDGMMQAKTEMQQAQLMVQRAALDSGAYQSGLQQKHSVIPEAKRTDENDFDYDFRVALAKLDDPVADLQESDDRVIDPAIGIQQAQFVMEKAEKKMQQAEADREKAEADREKAEIRLQQLGRGPGTNMSGLDYCDKSEAAVRNQNTLLRLKVEDLERRDETFVADVLRKVHTEITELCKHYPETEAKKKLFQEEASVPLNMALESSTVKANRGVREFLSNFLLVISGVGIAYLAKTAEKRGSFWYHPETDTEKKLKKMKQELNPAEFIEKNKGLDSNSSTSLDSDLSSRSSSSLDFDHSKADERSLDAWLDEAGPEGEVPDSPSPEAQPEDEEPDASSPDVWSEDDEPESPFPRR